MKDLSPKVKQGLTDDLVELQRQLIKEQSFNLENMQSMISAQKKHIDDLNNVIQDANAMLKVL